MKNSKLALFGGNKTINYKYNSYNPIGLEEVNAAKKVVESGVLSKFLGCWEPDFFGGPKVQEFERKCEEYFGVKHAVTVNSWTSGLIAAIGAIGIEPGDEIIVSPWTMCASATAILHWNAIPVFADIEEETFNLDPISVEKNISPQTKAILAIDIFGHPCDADALRKIAHKNDLKLITDTAQAPGSFYKGKLTGTFSDVGGYSLNYHKHINTGEGGIIVTNDEKIFERLQLIRNHAEAVVEGKGVNDITNMVGYNFRLGEIECSIGIEQLKKISKFVSKRQDIAEQLSAGLQNLRGLRTPVIKDNCTHSFYIYPLILDVQKVKVSREKIISALKAEGVEGLIGGYANIHLLPIFQKKIAYGSQGFPWNSEICKREVSYDKGICPIAENLHDNTFLGYEMCLHDLSNRDVKLIIEAFKKVWNNLDELR
ncbi:MAG: DegT/DnrJ/EryC1/StrS family aminotransferase [Flavobacteriaceae bacterium]|nr:DegT/DnrJ/EryC1/StrS family aminotransferase [Flavobacteriaceae bacterium]